MKKTAILALCMALITPQSVFAYVTEAASPSDMGKTEAQLNGYSEETWAKLMDNTLEYTEIEDLVKNFNINISSAYKSFNDNVDNLNNAIETLKSAKKSLESLESVAVNSGDIQNMMIYKAQEKGLSMTIQAMGITKKKLSGDNASASAPIRSARSQAASGVRSMMIGYKTMEAQENILNQTVQVYEEALNAANQSNGLGLMTAADVIKAGSDLSNAKASLLSLRANKDSLYRNLIMMCGWQPDAAVEIGEIPPVSEDELNSLNPETDIITAIGNNKELIESRHDTSSRSTAAVDAKLYKSSKDEDMLRTDLNELYDKIQTDKKALEAARIGNEGAVLSDNALETGKNLGMVAGAHYLGEKLAVIQKQAEYNTAILELRSDYNAYMQALEGNISIE